MTDQDKLGQARDRSTTDTNDLGVPMAPGEGPRKGPKMLSQRTPVATTRIGSGRASPTRCASWATGRTAPRS